MPRYHLKLELYPAPGIRGYGGTGGRNAGYSNSLAEPTYDNIWRPTAGASIFDDLPAHPPQSSNSGSRLYPANTESLGVTAQGESIQGPTGSRVIDCGSASTTGGVPDTGDGSTSNTTNKSSTSNHLVFLNKEQWRARTQSTPHPTFKAGINFDTAAKDWRFGRISIQSFDIDPPSPSLTEQKGSDTMEGKKTMPPSTGAAGAQAVEEPAASLAGPATSLGPIFQERGQATKARYIPLVAKNTEAGYGIVHLYRESDESSALRATAESLRKGGSSAEVDEGNTILCIPAVPSYFSPTAFLSWVGEKWRDDVTHYRMVMTSWNRYMVIMKLRDHRRALEWQKEFDKKEFDSYERDVICHVAFIESITVETPSLSADPKAGAGDNGKGKEARSSSTILPLKPFPPPTADLTELPTCTICLERMDDTAGLVTIPCQHIFHCRCLQTWKAGGCVVCRATTPAALNADSKPFGSPISNICIMCNATDNLWMCLICGNVGCGRYDKAHAKKHWLDTAHAVSLELKTQYIWDYRQDKWVHRLIRDNSNKVVELPGASSSTAPQSHSTAETGQQGGQEQEQEQEQEEMVPRAKLDNLSVEYADLIEKQLRSQREYFDDLVQRAASKTSQATAAAESLVSQMQETTRLLAELKEDNRIMKEQTVPTLEKDLERERHQVAKLKEVANRFMKSYEEERKMSSGMSVKIKHLEQQVQQAGDNATQIANLKKTVEELQREKAELEDQNHDLMAALTGQAKIAEMRAKGEIEEGELEGGTVSAPTPPAAAAVEDEAESEDEAKESKKKKKKKRKSKK